MAAPGWVDSFGTGEAGSVARFDPSVRTAGELAGAGPAWPSATPLVSALPAAAVSAA